MYSDCLIKPMVLVIKNLSCKPFRNIQIYTAYHQKAEKCQDLCFYLHHPAVVDVDGRFVIKFQLFAYTWQEQ